LTECLFRKAAEPYDRRRLSMRIAEATLRRDLMLVVACSGLRSKLASDPAGEGTDLEPDPLGARLLLDGAPVL